MSGDKYLPGLEGDPTGAIVENWSDADWATWLQDNVESSERFSALVDGNEVGFAQNQLGLPDSEATKWGRAFSHKDIMDPSDGIAEVFTGLHPNDASQRLRRLGPEARAEFFVMWYRIEHGISVGGGADVVAPKPPKSKWKTVVITGVAVVVVGAVGLAVVSSGSGDEPGQGNDATQTEDPEQDEESVEDDGSGESEEPVEGEEPVASDESGVTEWTVTDPIGDMVASFDDMDPLENPDPAGDIEVMDVENQGADTTVTVRFSGAAKDMSINSGQSINAGVLVVFPDGRMIDIIWDSGGCKISDSSDVGDGIECRWLDDRDLELRVKGWKPIPGTSVTFVTYQSAGIGEGVSSDMVELQTD
ncbi:MAG: hypothetical protein WBM90_10835 [Acidimicrobiia bacterium]